MSERQLQLVGMSDAEANYSLSQQLIDAAQVTPEGRARLALIAAMYPIAGTSTGGIIALGLGLGYPATEILGLYERHGSAVFGGGLLGKLRGLFRPRYDPRPLRAALEEQFSQRKLGESANRLVIPSLNLQTGEVYVYKTAHHERFERDYKVSAVTVAMATAAAPTYFPAQSTAAGTPLVDVGEQSDGDGGRRSHRHPGLSRRRPSRA